MMWQMQRSGDFCARLKNSWLHRCDHDPPPPHHHDAAPHALASSFPAKQGQRRRLQGRRVAASSADMAEGIFGATVGANSEGGAMTRIAGTHRLYECDSCHKKMAWQPGWMIYGSIALEEASLQ